MKKKYETIKEIIEANRQAGFYFFEEKTMEFFSSKLGEKVIGGRYFVTSERGPDQTRRFYTIRRIDEDGAINTTGLFQAFTTRQKAERAAMLLTIGEVKKTNQEVHA